MIAWKLSIALPSFATPPQFYKNGYYVSSLNRIARWMAEQCEAAGVEIYPGFAGDKLLYAGNRVVGVRTGDMGIDHNGNRPRGRATLDPRSQHRVELLSHDDPPAGECLSYRR